MDPFEMAKKFGFPTFMDFLNSDCMQKYIKIMRNERGENCFIATEMPKFQHIRKEQIESLQNIIRK